MKFFMAKWLLFSMSVFLLVHAAAAQESIRLTDIPTVQESQLQRGGPGGGNNNEVDAVRPLGYLPNNVINFRNTFAPLNSANSLQVGFATADRDDNNSNPIDIQFPFSYRGKNYNFVTLNTNGFLVLGTNPPSRADLYFPGPRVYSEDAALFSLAIADSNILSPFNVDLVTAATAPAASFRYSTTVIPGSNPARRVFTVQWGNVRDKLGGQLQRISFQVKLYEGTNFIDFAYGSWNAAPVADDFVGATIGIKGARGQYIFGSKFSGAPWATGTSWLTDRNNFLDNQHNYRNNFLPDQGRTYRFTTRLNANVGVSTVINLPTPACGGGIIPRIGVVVTNGGAQAATNVPVTLRIDRQTPLTRTIIIPFIDSSRRDTVYFGPYDFRLPGAYSVTAFTDLPSDLLRGNDTLRPDTVLNLIPERPTWKINDFDGEKSLQGWVTHNLNGDASRWQILQAAARSLSGARIMQMANNRNGSKDLLISNCFALKRRQRYKVRWRHGNLNNSTTGATKLEVLILKNQSSDTTGALHLWKDDNILTRTATAWQDDTVSFFAPTTGTYYIGFYCYSAGGTNATNILALENIQIDTTAGTFPTINNSVVAFDSTCSAAGSKLCSGGSVTVRIGGLLGLKTGAELKALVISPTFTDSLPVAQYSTTPGGPYLPGPYIYNGDVPDLYVRLNIPTTLPLGDGYRLQFKTTLNTDTANYLRCAGGGLYTLRVVEPPRTVPAVPQTAFGQNQWIGHMYTYSPTTTGEITPVLVPLQNFYDPARYQGRINYDSLRLDINYGTTGGAPGTAGDGTSVSCDTNKVLNFCMRLRRTQTFAPGRYRFTIQGDDGIRLSIDSGRTWLLDMFKDQNFANGFASTDAAAPNGVCLNGSTGLVIEYFQHLADSRLAFTVTPVSLPIGKPLRAGVCGGLDTAFAIRPADPGATYQWQVLTNGTFTDVVNGPNYANAGTSTLRVLNVPVSFDKLLYRSVVSYGCGTIFSDTARLLISDPTIITLQPTDLRLCNEAGGSFKVSATGVGVLYKWEADTGTGFRAISGPAAQEAEFVFLRSSYKDGAKFRSLVTGACGGGLTSEVTLNLTPQTIISAQPAGVTLCGLSSGTFSIAATGSNLRYQWLVKNAGVYQPIADATTASLNVTAAAYPAGGIFRVRLTTTCGDSLSDSAVFAVNVPVAINGQPASLNACKTATSFSVQAVGTGARYTWQSSANGINWDTLTTGGVYTGIASTTLAVTNVQGLDGTRYRVIVTGDCGTLISNAATLTVFQATAITTQPTSVILCNQTDGSYTVAATGTNVAYQWQVNTGAGFADIAGAQTGTLNVRAAAYPAGATFLCKISTGCGDTLSAIATLTVQQPVALTAQPASVTACTNTASFTVAATGTNAQVQWQSSTNGTDWSNLPAGAPYTGTDQPTLSINNLAGLNNLRYRAQVSGVCGAGLTSTAATLVVKAAAVITTQPVDNRVCDNNTPIRVVATGTDVKYQWEFTTPGGSSWKPLQPTGGFSNVTTPTLLVNKDGAGLVAQDIRVRITGDCSSDLTSTAISLTLCGDTCFISPPEWNVIPLNGRAENSELFVIRKCVVENFSMRVISRWGRTVFTSTDPTNIWNGIRDSSPAGTYYYYIAYTVNGTVTERKGYVELVGN